MFLKNKVTRLHGDVTLFQYDSIYHVFNIFSLFDRVLH